MTLEGEDSFPVSDSLLSSLPAADATDDDDDDEEVLLS